MNIFMVDPDPLISAQNLVDKHVVKMTVETAQLLSTAHYVLDGVLKNKKYHLDDERADVLYKPTHFNHPSAVWTRVSSSNYQWLTQHFIALLDEYTYRYGKHHKTSRLAPYLVYLPNNIEIGPMTPISCAMPDEYKLSDPIESYRNFYRNAKSHIHKWTKREEPKWVKF